jgi:hypothetical protein
MTRVEAWLKAMQGEVFSDRETTELPVSGESPWGWNECPAGVWSWSQDDTQVLVGEGPRHLAMVTYAEAVQAYRAQARPALEAMRAAIERTPGGRVQVHQWGFEED